MRAVLTKLPDEISKGGGPNMYTSLIYLLLIALVVSACASQKTPVPTGGSRADGVVELSYEVGMFEKPEVDWATANRSASERCRAWGYTSAEPFGGQKTNCQHYNAYGNCTQAIITVDYQCIESQ
ncbi:MAG: YecR-like lipofamily protein [Anaerolineae bacterium]|nr:YecR-like lipofamily protein [Anaerolineae bacterium]